MKKRILLLGTGGTIACKETKSGLAPMITAEELISFVPEAAGLCEIETEQICNLDSTDVRPSDWLAFAAAIERRYEDFDGFVICHGTDTLAYTAAALSYLVRNSVKPIIITGAQKPIDARDTDARKNLRDSLICACDEGQHQVAIVFDGKVIAGTRAKKERSKSYNAFSSINFPNLAVVRETGVIRYIRDEVTGPVQFAHGVSERVFILKIAPGTDPAILPVLFERYDCIIVESFGVGGLPSYLMGEFRRQMMLHDTLVIIATQVAEEGSDMTVYRVGHDVKEDFGLLETYDMTLEAAYAKACWLLAQEGLSHSHIKALFYEPVAHDLTYLPE
ncbi:MAG: asparaginase [Firmicutes bacterium]|nr:asparaginase [Bacillota bacterium]